MTPGEILYKAYREANGMDYWPFWESVVDKERARWEKVARLYESRRRRPEEAEGY